MAVAEKTATETVARDPRQQMLQHGAVAALYVLASLWLIFVGLPALWRILDLTAVFNEFLADSLLILVTLPAAAGLLLLALNLEGPHPVKGLRAAAAYLVFSVIFSGLLITAPEMLWTVIGLVLLGAAIFLYFQPAVGAWLVRVEEQGWFHGNAFKPNQGLRVRRATVAGFMVLVFCGIITLINHGTLRTGTFLINRPFGTTSAEAPNPWIVNIPFIDLPVVFMFMITLTVPIVLMIGAGWFAWRLVNWPTFADFLIATEAEMNKVSWTTRKRLYQDTIVVLVTVVLFTVFLFVVDILWIKILTNPIVPVLKHDTREAMQKNQAGAQW
jgi:preprotein translocase SecE subunit